MENTLSVYVQREPAVGGSRQRRAAVPLLSVLRRAETAVPL